MSQAQEEINKHQREQRRKNGNIHTKRYEKTVNGFLVRAYRNMLSRTKGLVKPHLYKGLPIMSKEDFYTWSKEDNGFHSLYGDWVKSNYARKLSPSINRKDVKDGYVFGNVEWITHSENSARGARNR